MASNEIIFVCLEVMQSPYHAAPVKKSAAGYQRFFAFRQELGQAK